MIKTPSGTLVEVEGGDVAAATAKEDESLSSAYQATVRPPYTGSGIVSRS